jgi:hypothetical protein
MVGVGGEKGRSEGQSWRRRMKGGRVRGVEAEGTESKKAKKSQKEFVYIKIPMYLFP